MPSDPLPQDMRDLLIRLDQRVQDGFADVRIKLDAMDKRADSIEQRVMKLEQDTANRPFLINQHNQMINDVDSLKTWRTESTAQIAGATKMASWVKAGSLAIIAVLGYFGYQIEFGSKSVTVEHKQTEKLVIPGT